MDDVQVIIADVLKEHMDCVSDRSKLKAILADYLTDDKVHLNILLNAFDEGIVEKIKNSQDITLVALQYVKKLIKDYGLTEEKAKWSIIVWCEVFGHSAVADVISEITTNNQVNDTILKLDDSKEYKMHTGIYRAGVDFPDGRIQLTAHWKNDSIGEVSYGKSRGLYYLYTEDSFTYQTYLDIKKDWFVKFETTDEDLLEIVAKKISD